MSYTYRHTRLVRVIDGDTLELEIDVGFKCVYRDHFRLARINTPERYAVGGKEATEHITSLLASGISKVETIKKDKYGRWLAEVFYPVEGGEMNVSDAMRQAGHAVPFME